MTTPIADLEDAQGVADLRAYLKSQGARVNLYSGIYKINCIFPDGTPNSYYQFSAGDTGPEEEAFDLIKVHLLFYFQNRITALDAALTGWNITY